MQTRTFKGPDFDLRRWKTQKQLKQARHVEAQWRGGEPGGSVIPTIILSGCLTVKSNHTSGFRPLVRVRNKRARNMRKKVQGNGFQGASQKQCIRTWNCTLSEERLSWVTDQEIP